MVKQLKLFVRDIVAQGSDTLKPEGVVYVVAQDGLVRCDLI